MFTRFKHLCLKKDGAVLFVVHRAKFAEGNIADDNFNNSNIDELWEDEFIFGDSNNLNIVTWNIEHFPKSDLTIQYLTN